MKLKLENTKIDELNKFPGEDGTTQVLVLTTVLRPSTAEELGILEGCFREEVAGVMVPRQYDVYPSPSLTIDGADVILGEHSCRATMVHKFKVHKPAGKPSNTKDPSLELTIRLHFAGGEPLSDWVDQQNKDTFTLFVNARQQDLQFGKAGADDASGEQTEEKPDTRQMKIVGGEEEEPETADKGADEEAGAPGPALASAREIGQGSRKRPGPPKRD